MAIRTYGPNAVDWEARVDVDRLRSDRLERLKQHQEANIVDAVDFLMRNRSVNGTDLYIDGGWLRSELQ
jgi:hypothetical protein